MSTETKARWIPNAAQVIRLMSDDDIHAAFKKAYDKGYQDGVDSHADMLEALKAVNGHFDFWGVSEKAVIVGIVQKAIAKAEGGQ